VLGRVAQVYRDDPEAVARNASAIMQALAEPETADGGPEITDSLLRELVQRMVGAVDPVYGGIGGAPKFPQWSFFWLLWRGAIRYGNDKAQAAVENTLIHICQGGIYDHLGGGFARYSVDERWLAPHFEKMLYDNALLIDLLTEVWRETQNPLLATRIAETVDWLGREMIAEGGGFASSLDADSEGEEGKFYVWSGADIADVLGSGDAAFFGQAYDMSEEGNWEGHTILNRLGRLQLLPEEDERRLQALRKKLLQSRGNRVRPGWDDKVLADWNGLMIAALARAAQIFDRPEWLALAERAFAFVETAMTRDGRLLHAYRKGRAAAPATASDYANMIWAALRLYQTTARDSYLTAARQWTECLDRHYWSEQPGAYAMTADDTADVIVRLKSGADDATPNANAVMVSNLAALSLLTGETRFADRARDILRGFSGNLARILVGHAGLLAAALDLIAPQLLVIVDKEAETSAHFAAVVSRVSLPGALQFAIRDGTVGLAVPAVVGKSSVGGRATAYLCLGPQCSAPISEANALRDALKLQRMAV
jgi:hypothetical protein